MIDARHILLDDGAFVQIARDIVRRGTDEFDATIVRLVIRFSAFEARQKTVVDIVSYREKIGIEETKEVLVTYLSRKDRNINRLLRYAELLKCSDIMKTYLEVLV